MKIAQLMHGEPMYLNCRKNVAEAARLMRDNDIGFVPVEKDDKMVGMLTDRDIAVRVVADGKNPETTALEDAMTEAVHFVVEDDDAEKAKEMMERRQIRRLPVIDREKQLVGVISLSDLTRQDFGAEEAGEALRQVTQ